MAHGAWPTCVQARHHLIRWIHAMRPELLRTDNIPSFYGSLWTVNRLVSKIHHWPICINMLVLAQLHENLHS